MLRNLLPVKTAITTFCVIEKSVRWLLSPKCSGQSCKSAIVGHRRCTNLHQRKILLNFAWAIKISDSKLDSHWILLIFVASKPFIPLFSHPSGKRPNEVRSSFVVEFLLFPMHTVDKISSSIADHIMHWHTISVCSINRAAIESDYPTLLKTVQKIFFVYQCYIYSLGISDYFVSSLLLDDWLNPGLKLSVAFRCHTAICYMSAYSRLNLTQNSVPHNL